MARWSASISGHPARAEATHDAAWAENVFRKRGVRPIIEYKEVRMILDNDKGTVTEF